MWGLRLGLAVGLALFLRASSRTRRTEPYPSATGFQWQSTPLFNHLSVGIAQTTLSRTSMQTKKSVPVEFFYLLSSVRLLKRTTFCVELTFYASLRHRFSQHPLASAGERKVNGGESKVSRQARSPHNLRAPRWTLKLAFLDSKLAPVYF